MECMRYLNNTMNAHGFGTIDLGAVCASPIADAAPTAGGDAVSHPPSIGTGDSLTAKIGLINAVYKLVVSHQSATEYRTEQTQRYDQLSVRHSETTAKLTTTANDLHSMNHKHWVSENKRRASEADARKLEQKLRAQIRELETKNIQIQRRDKQYIHEMRKREKEYHTLQDRVTKLLQDKNRDVKSGLELINTLKAQHAATEKGSVRTD